MDVDSEKKKAEEIKKCIIKRRLMFENYMDCLFNDKIIAKLQHDLEVTIMMYTLQKSIRLT